MSHVKWARLFKLWKKNHLIYYEAVWEKERGERQKEVEWMKGWLDDLIQTKIPFRPSFTQQNCTTTYSESIKCYQALSCSIKQTLCLVFSTSSCHSSGQTKQIKKTRSVPCTISWMRCNRVNLFCTNDVKMQHTAF